MKGLLYKELVIFIKSIDKKLYLIAGGAILLLMCNTGIYAGMFASVMLAMTVGMQNVMSFASDEKAGWKKYQLAMPLGGLSVVVSKYVSVICTLLISLVGSLLFSLLSAALCRHFDISLFGISIAAAILVPLLWTGVCLPFTYWFGFRSAQIMGMLAVVPMFYFVKYFEDGPGFAAMADSFLPYGMMAGGAVTLLFAVSMVISMIGYGRKK